MYPLEVLGDRPGLVSLELADEVPGQLEPLQCLDLGQGLLEIALPEVLDALPRSATYQINGVRLADGEQCDRIDTAPGVLAGQTDALPHGAYVHRQILRNP